MSKPLSTTSLNWSAPWGTPSAGSPQAGDFHYLAWLERMYLDAVADDAEGLRPSSADHTVVADDLRPSRHPIIVDLARESGATKDLPMS